MHLDAYLAPCPGYGWDITPVFKTNITDLQNGDEYRNAGWIEVRHRATAPFENINKDAYREIKRMFLVCRGMLYAFRFRDELDYEANADIFGIGDGVKTEFQLLKISVVDGVEYPRKVYALVATPTITVDATPTAAFTVNLRTGRIRFDAAPAAAAVLRWSGEFDLWVRFANDEMPFSLDDPDATNGAVTLWEVPPPAEATP
jgi:uncharacterized protein (TIGR02217 family)